MVPLSGKCYPLILIAVLLPLLGFGGYRHIYRLQSIVIITIIIPSSCVLFLGTRVIILWASKGTFICVGWILRPCDGVTIILTYSLTTPNLQQSTLKLNDYLGDYSISITVSLTFGVIPVDICFRCCKWSAWVGFSVLTVEYSSNWAAVPCRDMWMCLTPCRATRRLIC